MINKLFPFLFKRQTIRKPKIVSHFYEGWLAYEEFLEMEKCLILHGTKIDDTKALILLDKAIECEVSQAYSARAFTLQALSFHYDAIEDFDKAISLSIYDANLYYGRGQSKKLIGDYDNAISDLALAVEYIKVNSALNKVYIEGSRTSGQISPSILYFLGLEDAIRRKLQHKNEPHSTIYGNMIKKIKRRSPSKTDDAIKQ